MKRIIIAISGRQRSGKDSLCDLLVQELPDFARVAFADPLKQQYGDTVGMTLQQVEAIKCNPAVRRVLIDIGAQGRAKSLTYWVNKAIEGSTGNIVIPDLRFVSEAGRLRQLQAEGSAKVFLVRVNADRAVRGKRGTLSNEDDPSEVELDNFDQWDYELSNEGAPHDLKLHARAIAECLLRFDAVYARRYAEIAAKRHIEYSMQNSGAIESGGKA